MMVIFDAVYGRWYGAVEGVGTEEKISLSVDSSEVFVTISFVF